MVSSTDKLHFKSILEVAALIQRREVSPIELTLHTLQRIKSLEPKLHSYALLMEDAALNAAQTAENEIRNGHYRGPLHGMPIAVKDLCYTQGIPTKGGLKVLEDFVPEYHATVITKLLDAGCIIMGKLHLTEGAVGGYHRQFPIPRNPWGNNLWPGGSSSGSGVAVAAGLCYGALGTDTGGSIRFPAMACGITGLKLQYGRVSRYGILPLAETMDHVGPMTRTVADSALILGAISGKDKHDSTTIEDSLTNIMEDIDKSLIGFRVGYDPIYSSEGVDPDLNNALDAAMVQLRTLGAEIVEIKVPDVSLLRENWKTICTYEAAKAHESHYPSKAAEYGAFFGDFLEHGYNTSKEQYLSAMQYRSEFSQQFNSCLSQVDALLCPGGGIPFDFPRELLYQSMDVIRQHMNPYTYFQFTIPANFSGLPSLSLPCGLSAKGIPYNMQFVGNQSGESTICQLGYAFQKATNWHRNHPDI